MLIRRFAHTSEVAIKLFGEEAQASKAVEGALDLISGFEQLVKPGDRVVIKPNLAAKNWVDDETKGEVTSLRVVEGVIKAILDLGARPIVAEGTASRWMGTTNLQKPST